MAAPSQEPIIISPADPSTSSHKGQKINSYSVSFKLSAIDFFKTGQTKEATARKFKVDPKRIREWIKIEWKLREMHKPEVSKGRKKFSISTKLSAVAYHNDGHTKEETAQHFGVDSKCVLNWVKGEDKLREIHNEEDSKGQKLISYSVSLKLTAIDFHKSGHSKEVTAREFGVDPKQIREWVKNEDKLRKLNDNEVFSQKPKRMRLEGGGRKPMFETLEANLLTYIQDLKSRNETITCKMLQIKAKELYASEILENGKKKKFAASKGWMYRFFQRNNISIGKMMDDEEEGADTLQDLTEEPSPPNPVMDILRVRSLQIQHRYDPSSITAITAIPIVIGHCEGFVVNQFGTQSVACPSSGITVCLAAKVNGVKLAPFVAFKDSLSDNNIDNSPSFIDGVICLKSPTGILTGDLAQVWAETVWRSWNLKTARLLCCDRLTYPIMSSVLGDKPKANTTVTVIPSEYSEDVVNLDPTWIKAFKDEYHDLYTKWLTSLAASRSEAENAQNENPTKELIAAWVSQAWMETAEQTIVDSFKSWGITNAIDGSEDDKIVGFGEGEPIFDYREELLEMGSVLVQNGGDLEKIQEIQELRFNIQEAGIGHVQIKVDPDLEDGKTEEHWEGIENQAGYNCGEEEEDDLYIKAENDSDRDSWPS